MSLTTSVPSAHDLCAPFERSGPLTLGVEEELLVLHPRRLHPIAADDAADALRDDRRVRRELPACQIELVSDPCAGADELETRLLAARCALRDAGRGRFTALAAGTHPAGPAECPITDEPRYAAIAEEYAWVARRSATCGLHVHVAVPGAERALAVYNALRGHVPELIALAANAPFLEARDTGLATVRPKLCESFPHAGVPPVIGSWEALADLLAWGGRSNAIPDATFLWWEVRLHPRFGTIEVRAADQQPTARDAAAIAGTIHALAAWLADRHDAGERLPAAPDERIAHNRWRAIRSGVDARLLDLDSGEERWARDVIADRLCDLEPYANALHGAGALRRAAELLDDPGTDTVRAIATSDGPLAATAWLVAAFERECDGA